MGLTCGMCGTCSGKTDDELSLPNGNLVSLTSFSRIDHLTVYFLIEIWDEVEYPIKIVHTNGPPNVSNTKK